MPANTSVQKALKAMEADKSKVLGLKYGDKVISTGDYLPRKDAQTAPEISWEGASQDKTYMLMCLDLDAPFVMAPILGPILHWCQPGVTASATKVLTSTDPWIADYIGPAPPPLSGPHRYTFFLYEQPAGFDASKFAPPNGEKVGPTARMFYSLDDWEKKAGLGEILAVNYFTSN